MRGDEEQRRQSRAGGGIHLNLQRRYVLGLLLVALSLLAGMMITGKAINRQRSDGQEINLAGRQRMLSQRIAKLSLELRDADPVKRKRVLVTLREQLTTFQEAERGLRRGSTRLGLPGDDRLGVDGVFSQVTEQASALVNSAAVLAERIEQDPEGAVDEQILQEIQETERGFLPVMDAFVFTLGSEALGRVQRAQRLNYMIHGLALFLLVLEALLIFQPAVRKIRRTMNQLRGAEEIITEKNERLEEVNKDLKKTLVKVLRGMHPICMSCKAIRGDDGEWVEMTRFLSERTAASFSHGLCERCAIEQYPDMAEEILRGERSTDLSDADGQLSGADDRDVP